MIMVKFVSNHPLAIALILSAAFISMYSNASAQDSHYWNHQYGTRANLLGGAVVGSIKDLSATYYNPAAIVPTMDSAFVISTEVLMFENIKVKAGLYDRIAINSLEAGTAPSIFAVRIPFGGLRDHQLAISYLNRQRFKTELNAKSIVSQDFLPSGLYVEEFAAEYLGYQYVNEDWGGVTWAVSRGERTRIGISTFFAYRSQRRRYQTIMQAVPDTGTPGTINLLSEERFWNVRLLWKVGLTTYIKPLVFGLTVTTPSISLFGRGSSFLNVSSFGFDLDGDDIPNYELAANFQEDISAYYRTPLSIALGTSYGYEKTTVHLTMEWFNRVKRFDAMVVDDFVAQSTGDTISIDYSHELDHVFNIGIGLDHKFNEDVSIYGGFTTDFSAFIPGSQTKLAETSWDIYHFTAGSTFTFYNINFTVGMGYSFGNETVDPLLEFSPEQQVALYSDDPGTDEVKYRRLKFIFGVSF